MRQRHRTRIMTRLAPAAGALFGVGLVTTVATLTALGPAGWVAAAALCALVFGLLAPRAAQWWAEATIDATTGLGNRRSMFARLERELSRTRRTGRPLAFMVLEIDDMKRCNDTYGHLIGDALLGAVARTLREGVRRTDTAVRWGGDEFGLIMPNTSVGDALILAERIRRLVADLAIDVGDGRTARTTISVGVAMSADDHGAYDLIARADQAMYSAKQRKNRVILAA